MRRSAATIGALFFATMVLAAPAWALETKPTNPPSPEVTSKPADQVLYIESVRYAGGNDDQVPDPGERLNVFFSVRNPTDRTVSGLTGTLAVGGTGISVVDGSTSWPDLAPGGIAESSTPFVIQIASDAPRSAPCSGPPAVEATSSVQPAATASDDVVSSGGNSGSGSVSTSEGQTAPGSAGSTEPGVVEPAPPATAEPAPIEPAPDSTNAPVAFEAKVTLTAEGTSADAGFYSGLACPLAAGDSNNTSITGGGTNDTSIGGGLPAEAARKAPAAPSATPYLLVVIGIAAAALVARSRLTASSR